MALLNNQNFPEEHCTGCAACFNICPQKCIRMFQNHEGYIRPKIDINICKKCGFCERVCPVFHVQKPNTTFIQDCYACWNKDEAIQLNSSSGGMFTVFAEYILDNGGIVFGAAYDENMIVKHIAVTQKDELKRLRGSKYVQSDIGYSYIKVKKELEKNKLILFSGTPCQIAGLYAICGKKYDNLLTCDVICRGVPSPGLFAIYIAWIESKFNRKLIKINFRDKCKGWDCASTIASFSDGTNHVLTGTENSFMRSFTNLFLNTACYKCRYANIKRQGDITLGDFWGIGKVEPFKYNSQNGISLIILNTEKGHRIFQENLKWFYSEKRDIKEAILRNPGLTAPAVKCNRREIFFKDYNKLDYDTLVMLYLQENKMKLLIKIFLRYLIRSYAVARNLVIRWHE